MGSGQVQAFSLPQRLRRDEVQLPHMDGSISTALVSSIALNMVQMVHLKAPPILDQSSNVLQHRLTPSPLVVALMGAQAVTHRHADHIIAVPDSVCSQAVAVAE